MKYSDEILSRAFERPLTMKERGELREAYLWEQAQDEKARSRIKDYMKKFNDNIHPLDKPRHRMAGKCANFIECPIDFKCRNYNPAHIKCQNCPLHETEEVCLKPELHNEKNFYMFFHNNKRERIDLDGEEK